MIGGQWLDVQGEAASDELHRLKTGALFSASVGCALAVVGLPPAEQAPWRTFGSDVGLLFQIVDDILDGDGFVLDVGVDGARRLADETAARTRACLGELDADTEVLLGIVDELAVRTA
jgi:geranylgeranyl pyrophosphate synthase